MLTITTTIHQAGEHMKTVESATETIVSRDSHNLHITYHEPTANMDVDFHIEQTEAHPIIHIERKGEYVSDMAFAMNRQTNGEYQLAPGQHIYFEIETGEITVAENWKKISWTYQLTQQRENLGEFHVEIEFVEEKTVQ